MSFLHLLNLDTVGGVEELFINFLQQAHIYSKAKQHLLITGQKPHPLFQERLGFADSIRFEKYFLGLKVPKFLRPSYRDLQLNRSSADTVVLWNRIGEFQTKKRLIYYEHGASWIEPQSNRWESFFKGVDKIIANSYAAKRLLELKWNVTLPVDVVENPLKPEIEAANGPKPFPQQIRLGYIGRLIPLKGISLIFHALKELHDLPITLTIAGDGPERAALEAEAKRLSLPVTFVGVQKNVSAFYDSIDLLLVPSIREPLGLVAQEAALRGCPVIASCIDGLPEVVRHDVTGICIPPTLPLEAYPSFGGSLQRLPDLVYDPVHDTLKKPCLIDPQELAKAIRQIATVEERFSKMSQEAIFLAQKRPNFTEYSQKLLDCFS